MPQWDLDDAFDFWLGEGDERATVEKVAERFGVPIARIAALLPSWQEEAEEIAEQRAHDFDETQHLADLAVSRNAQLLSITDELIALFADRLLRGEVEPVTAEVFIEAARLNLVLSGQPDSRRGAPIGHEPPLHKLTAFIHDHATEAAS